jgi:hypothetical protein
MTLADLIATFRGDTTDTDAQKYLWPDADVVRWLNEAEREAAIRRHLIYDDSTADVCSIAVTSASATYPLNATVIEVMHARLVDAASLTNDLMIIQGRQWLEEIRPDWRGESAGLPLVLVHDDSSIRLIPAPSASYTLALEVHRLPLSDMALTAAVTFQDTGDTVTHTAHGRLAGDRVEFETITGTTGIAIATEYFLRDVTTNTYKLAATSTGDALALTTNGTGTALYGRNGPEIGAQHHYRLLDWVKHRAYGLPDTDTFDKGRSLTHLAAFEAYFGPRPDANLRKSVNAPIPRVSRTVWC